MIDERDVRPEGQAAAGWEGSSGLDQPAIRLVACQTQGAMEQGHGAIRIGMDPHRDLHVMESEEILLNLQAQDLLPHRIVLGHDRLQLGAIRWGRRVHLSSAHTLVDAIGKRIHLRATGAVLGIDRCKADERSCVRIEPSVEMAVGAVEAITDIGFGILLCIDDNMIAEPDLFT